MSGVAIPIPTKSQVESWQSDHLESAAAWLKSSARESERLFEEHRRNLASPAGTEWRGSASEGALHRATADVKVVQRQGDVQRDAAGLAERGADDIRRAQRAVLSAIADAEEEGFNVGEDLSVRDTSRWTDPASARVRQTAAVTHAEYIRWTADQLVQTDGLISRRLRAKASELGEIPSKAKTSPTVFSS